MEIANILERLLPEISIAVIFAYLLINISKNAAESHREKTVAFMRHLTEQRDAFMAELKDIRKTDHEDREVFRGAIKENTETMKNVLSVLRRK